MSNLIFFFSNCFCSGKMVNEQKRTSQGIILTAAGSDILFVNSPLSAIIRTNRNQPVQIFIYHQISGGKQTVLSTNRELARFLGTSRLALTEFLQITKEIKSATSEIHVRVQESTTLARQFLDVLQKARKIMYVTKTVFVIRQLKHRVREIMKKVKDVKENIADLISNLKFEGEKLGNTKHSLIFRLEEVLAMLPKSMPLFIKQSPVRQSLRGIKIKQFGKICIKQLCFKNINMTVELSSSGGSFSQNLPPHLSVKEPSVVVSGHATTPLKLGHLLSLSPRSKVSLWIDRKMKSMDVRFESRINIFGFSKEVVGELKGKTLVIETEVFLLEKFPTSLQILAHIGNSEWTSLMYHAIGKMNKTSKFVSLLESQINNYTKDIVQKAQRRVENVKKALKSAQERKKTIVELVDKQDNMLRHLEKVKRMKEKELNYTRLELTKTKMHFDARLSATEQLIDQEWLKIKQCPYVPLSIGLPQMCENERIIKEQKCRVIKKELDVEELKEFKYKTFYLVPNNGPTVCRGNCYTRSWLAKAFFGCSRTCWKVPGVPIRVYYYNSVTRLVTIKKTIKLFDCSVHNTILPEGYGIPYKCFVRGSNVRVVDSTCLRQNAKSLRKIETYGRNHTIENIAKFDRYDKMRQQTKRVGELQLQLSRLRVKHRIASNEQRLLKARLRQSLSSEEAFDIDKVKSQEKRALKLGMKLMEIHSKHKYVSIEAINFSLAVSKKVKHPTFATVFLKTVEGSKSLHDVPMDFNNEHFLLHSAKHITDLLLKHKKDTSRRRRHIKQENNTISEKEIQQLDQIVAFSKWCAFSRNANLFMGDIVDSLEFAISESEKFFKDIARNSNSNGRGIEVEGKKQNAMNGSLLRNFADMLEAFKGWEAEPAQHWENTLISWRNFVDVLPKLRKLPDCVGARDCVEVILEKLINLYESVDDPYSLSIEQSIPALKENINRLLFYNLTMNDARGIVVRVKSLLTRSNDTVILCGSRPQLERTTQQNLTVLQGEQRTILCEAESGSRVHYTWYRNGKIIQGAMNSTLTIFKASSTSAGAYQCRVSNHIGSVWSNYTLITVESKPIITQHPSNKTLFFGSGEPLYIVCNGTGQPKPLFRWFLTPDESVTQILLANHTNEFLYKEKPSFDDAGYYHCEATNKHGTMRSQNARVDVLNGSIGQPRMLLKLKVTVPETNSFNSSLVPRLTLQRMPINLHGSARQIFIHTISQLMGVNETTITELSYVNDSISEATVTFVVQEQVRSEESSGSDEEALTSFAQSRMTLGSNFRVLQHAVESGSLKVPLDDGVFVGEPQSLAVELLPPKCDLGQYAHKNGYLCGKLPLFSVLSDP